MGDSFPSYGQNHNASTSALCVLFKLKNEMLLHKTSTGKTMNKLSCLWAIFLLLGSVNLFAQERLHEDSIPVELNSVPDFDHFPSIDYDLVQDRLTCIQTTIPLNFNERVFAFVKYFTEKDRDYTRMVMRRATYYFPIFEKILKENNMPDEIKYLSIIESGLNPRAISRVGAVGLWQFMPFTGIYYKLHQDWYIDERMDPYLSTEAACLYLKQMYDMFGDWELALAAYNTGPGNVRKAMRRSGKKTFWGIYRYLPRETRGYVPQWAAMVYAFNYAEDHNLVVDNEQEYQMEYDTVQVHKFLNLQILSSQLDVCLDDLRKLNPALRHDAVPDVDSPFILRIPSDKLDYFTENRFAILDSASHGKKIYLAMAKNSIGSTYGRDRIIHRVRSGEVLGTIARRYGVRIGDIRKWNHLRGSLIRIGQRLNIWVYPSAYTPSAPAQTSTIKEAPAIIADGTGKVYKVQPGDTLWDISRKFEGLTIEKLKALNNLTSNKITPGQKLIVGK